MNQYSQPHYTLPGVMHYLQTEFTKNERDRITWDLERLEMKSYINKLESENRDLRHKLSVLESQIGSSATANEQSAIHGKLDLKQGPKEIDSLTQSRLRVQENVKEIIYLLNGPNITSDLSTITNRNLPIHEMEDLNLNTDTQNKSSIHSDLDIELPDDITQKKCRNTDNKGVSDVNGSNVGSLFRKNESIGTLNGNSYHLLQTEVENETNKPDVDDLTSDTTEVAPVYELNEQMDTMSDENQVPLPIQDNIETTPSQNNYQPLLNQILTINRNRILATLNNKLRYYTIKEDSSCCDMMVSFDTLLNGMAVKGVFWLNENMIMFILNDGVALWDVRLSKLVEKFPLYDDIGLKFEDITSTNMKNKWLMLTTHTGVNIIEWEWDDQKKEYENNSKVCIKNKYDIHIPKCMAAVLGITEKSFIVITNDPLKLLIYNFNGEILQSVNISKEITTKKITSEIELYLNKESSKLLIQMNRHLIFYSFEQKRIVQQKTLVKTPTSIYFRYIGDIIGIAYDDGVVELRKLNDFDKVVFEYSHLTKNLTNEEDIETGNKGSHSIYIDTAYLNNKYIFVSLGDNVLKLETANI